MDFESKAEVRVVASAGRETANASDIKVTIGEAGCVARIQASKGYSQAYAFGSRREFAGQSFSWVDLSL